MSGLFWIWLALSALTGFLFARSLLHEFGLTVAIVLGVAMAMGWWVLVIVWLIWFVFEVISVLPDFIRRPH